MSEPTTFDEWWQQDDPIPDVDLGDLRELARAAYSAGVASVTDGDPLRGENQILRKQLADARAERDILRVTCDAHIHQIEAGEAEIERLNRDVRLTAYNLALAEIAKLRAVVEAAREAMQSELSYEHEGHYYLDITPRLAHHLRTCLAALEKKPENAP